LSHNQYAKLSAMRTSVILTLVGFAVVAVIAARPAAAACVCVCVDGKPKAQCPSILETAICPASICAADQQRAAPPITRKEDCRIVQGVNPASGRVERQLVCK